MNENDRKLRVLLLEDEDGARPQSIMIRGAAVAFGFAAELVAILRDEVAPPRPPLVVPPPLDVLLGPSLNRHARRKAKAERRRSGR